MVYAGQLQLSGVVEDVRMARHWLGTLLLSYDVEAEVVDATVLLVSELVTNAVVHAGTPVTVGLIFMDNRLRVEVTDRHPGLIPSPSMAGDDDEHGRGIRIVEAFATGSGTERSDTTKTVWFEMPRC